ncbi:MAG: Gfo/Idh/MocA family oxidoreductase [Chloroflexota bacterium]|nr:Gfo/Idh/MocA family oxidoreductase [Chloroflexota bacterium]
MNHEPLRAGIIGAGANTIAKHIPGLQAIEGVQIVGVCNRSRESSARVAGQFDIPQVFDSWMDVITAPDINAIVIGTWPYMHARITIAALAAGKHVLCEARMAMNAAEAHAMHTAARANPHLVAQIVPSPMTLAVDRTIKRLIAEGYLGDLLAIEVRAGGEFLNPDSPLHWRQNRDLSGLNIMSLGIWYEAVMRWAGSASAVTAMGKTFTPMRKNAAGYMQATDIPEHIDVLADMACGAQLHMQISAVAGLAGAPEAWLFGSEGTLRYSQDTLAGGRRGDAQLQPIPIPDDERGGWRVEEEFVNAIRGLEPVTHTTFLDGVKYMEFTEAVNRSMAERRTVPLPLF